MSGSIFDWASEFSDECPGHEYDEVVLIAKQRFGYYPTIFKCKICDKEESHGCTIVTA